MRKIWITLVMAFCMAVNVNAQDYRTGFGVRTGPSYGITGKYFFAGDKAVEALLLSRWNGFHVTGLYEIHARAFLINGLNWYYGAGAHYGSFTGKEDRKFYSVPDKSYAVIGVDGILGLEYNFPSLPFNVSLDWKPDINFTGGELFWPDELALSIRYVWGVR